MQYAQISSGASMTIKLSDIELNQTGSKHYYQGNPLYNKVFYKALKFHPPGLAAVEDSSGAYHINVEGLPAYHQRYTQAFGFYNERAVVADSTGWFHILPDGSPIYEERYKWCGNYQENCCVVETMEGDFFHIDLLGKRLYSKNYTYTGDFHDGTATVQNEEGSYTHINKAGEYLHGYWFADLDVFHKGYARAKDTVGWFHIDKQGLGIYHERYQEIEPFYNGLARCRTSYGALIRINERGECIDQLKDPEITAFQQLSADIVGYWRTQIIKAAVDIDLFDYLPVTISELSQKTQVELSILQRFIRALQELSLIEIKDNKVLLTEKSQFLTSNHLLSLKSAVIHWADAHYTAWMSLTDALKSAKGMYQNSLGQPLFEWLDKKLPRLTLYHQAMTAYARHDYQKLSLLIDTKQAKTLVDAAGGQGILLQFILENNRDLTGILLERPSLVNQIIIPDRLQSRMTALGFDLFQPWPVVNVDIITLSRVLHDWNDEETEIILNQAVASLQTNGRILIIEFLLEEDSPQGGMLDMNMLVITGGRERTLQDFITIADKYALKFIDCKKHGSYSILEFQKKSTCLE